MLQMQYYCKNVVSEPEKYYLSAFELSCPDLVNGLETSQRLLLEFLALL